MADLERTRIHRRLDRGQAVELDWGLVLSPPSCPGARGGGGSYRWIFYDPPVHEDGTRGERVQRTARELDDRAWLRIEGDLRALEAAMVAQGTGTRLDATFGELAAHWLEPTRHPDWSSDYAKKLRSVTTTWLLADTPVPAHVGVAPDDDFRNCSTGITTCAGGFAHDRHRLIALGAARCGRCVHR